MKYKLIAFLSLGSLVFLGSRCSSKGGGEAVVPAANNPKPAEGYLIYGDKSMDQGALPVTLYGNPNYTAGQQALDDHVYKPYAFRLCDIAPDSVKELARNSGAESSLIAHAQTNSSQTKPAAAPAATGTTQAPTTGGSQTPAATQPAKGSGTAQASEPLFYNEYRFSYYGLGKEDKRNEKTTTIELDVSKAAGIIGDTTEVYGPVLDLRDGSKKYTSLDALKTTKKELKIVNGKITLQQDSKMEPGVYQLVVPCMLEAAKRDDVRISANCTQNCGRRSSEPTQIFS